MTLTLFLFYQRVYFCYILYILNFPGSESDEFHYVDNDLYKFLNKPKNLDGKMILGGFKNTGEINREALCDLVIKKELMKDQINWK